MSGYFAQNPCPAYKISKTMLNMLTVQYSLEYGPKGFTVFAISPGVSLLLLRGSPCSADNEVVVAHWFGWWSCGFVRGTGCEGYGGEDNECWERAEWAVLEYLYGGNWALWWDESSLVARHLKYIPTFVYLWARQWCQAMVEPIIQHKVES